MTAERHGRSAEQGVGERGPTAALVVTQVDALTHSRECFTFLHAKG